ncbi:MULTISPECIES: hypothetical protein [Actinotignum]|uniref:hypothetical protein n=1 Tax=Actinotignum TaxID=1653174 RepID=UPI002551BFC1|nr:MULTISPECIES: hypothetical protein [Actinotignum]MDE1536037.1 hypothetical protein [Actinotignum schaalii]MDK7272336.1 hypothetical protein [Actinotignum schaalii]MDY5145340.1 hypothetical protein [Actinotignum timonense]
MEFPDSMLNQADTHTNGQAPPSTPRELYVPNELTEQVIEHAEKIMAGELPEDGAVFDNLRDALTFLDTLV